MPSEFYEFGDDFPHEILVGDHLDFSIVVLQEQADASMDWLGIYPASVPTLPGTSQGRFRYFNNPIDADLPLPGTHRVIKIRLEPWELPNHAGIFEARIHLNNYYGTPDLVASFYMAESPIPFYRKALFLALIVAVVHQFQHFLNAKGSCPHIDPDSPDVIDDWFVSVTLSLNKWFIANEAWAEAAQAASSFFLDAGLLLLLFLSTTRRSSVRPFLAVFLLQASRFVAQIMAVIPCAPGFIWPEGKLFGYRIISIFCDYENTNDMFFSGHTGTALVVGLELHELDYIKTAWVQLWVILPLISVWVVSTRVHRGIDVVAAILAGVAASSIAKSMADSIDRRLRVNTTAAVMRRLHTNIEKVRNERTGSFGSFASLTSLSLKQIEVQNNIDESLRHRVRSRTMSDDGKINSGKECNYDVGSVADDHMAAPSLDSPLSFDGFRKRGISSPKSQNGRNSDSTAQNENEHTFPSAVDVSSRGVQKRAGKKGKRK